MNHHLAWLWYTRSGFGLSEVVLICHRWFWLVRSGFEMPEVVLICEKQ